MARLEEISRLTPGICRYCETVGGRVAELSRTELSGMLAGLSKDAENYARAKYAGDEDAFWKLVYSIRVWVAGIAVREGWEIVRGRPTMYNLAAIAVAESVGHNRCGTCKGTGFERTKLCRTCHGHTVVWYADAKIADSIGLSHTTFKRTWYSRYVYIVDYVNDYDRIVKIRLRNYDQYEISA